MDITEETGAVYALTHREITTMLHALRFLQGRRKPVMGGERAGHGSNDTEASAHFEDCYPLDNESIDALCERMDMLDADGKDASRVVITVNGGVAEVHTCPRGVDVLLVDYDNLDCTTLDDLDGKTAAWLQVNDKEYWDNRVATADRCSPA